ncbi:hypothetical protein [Paraburkholderia sp. WP4_3_2]|uniref:hypothetical protein n=1 Tax=Paraburkholderia sp. WP4_3_2 TaxID=2587162 RepID=UPI00161C7B05|nr:hypothetical protein [Paraburkholderia sp. WP4_3_2]MBB3256881.1 hypothetical protein [Paraburkholderia sp. WP4_3_2]
MMARVKGGALAKLAGQWANEPAFLESLSAIGQPARNPDDAAAFMRRASGIVSRAQLDHDAAARARFNRRVRAPYAKYRASVGCV